MRNLGLIPLLLLGVLSGVGMAEFTASQELDRSTAPVGETVTVMLTMQNSGSNASQVTVTAGLPQGIVTSSPGMWSEELYPGSVSMISYPITALESGYYEIASNIYYTEEGIQQPPLSMISSFTATYPPESPPEGPSPKL
jgi:uncharacterized repeat protein (TIGR01451 family)